MRLRALLDRRYAIVVAILLLLAAVGAWGVYATHVAPETETDERVVASWTGTGEFEHGATVVNETEAFPAGERVADRSTYFTTAMPELDGAYVYTYEGADGDLDVRTELELVIRSVGEEDDEEIVYWQVSEPLGEELTEGLDAGESHEIPFEVDVAATNDRIETIEEELDASPGDSELVVRARTSVEGSAAGEPVEESVVHDMHVEPDDGTYTVGNPATYEESYESVERATVPVEQSPLRSIGSPLLLVASLACLGALVGARNRGTLVPDEDRTRIEHERRRAEFDDWISRGRLPPELRDRPRVAVESLEELVDVAIDSDRRVIEEVSDGSYYVVDDGVVYAHEPDGGDRQPAESVDGTG